MDEKTRLAIYKFVNVALYTEWPPGEMPDIDRHVLRTAIDAAVRAARMRPAHLFNSLEAYGYRWDQDAGGWLHSDP